MRAENSLKVFIYDNRTHTCIIVPTTDRSLNYKKLTTKEILTSHRGVPMQKNQQLGRVFHLCVIWVHLNTGNK